MTTGRINQVTFILQHFLSQNDATNNAKGKTLTLEVELRRSFANVPQQLNERTQEIIPTKRNNHGEYIPVIYCIYISPMFLKAEFQRESVLLHTIVAKKYRQISSKITANHPTTTVQKQFIKKNCVLPTPIIPT